MNDGPGCQLLRGSGTKLTENGLVNDPKTHDTATTKLGLAQIALEPRDALVRFQEAVERRPGQGRLAAPLRAFHEHDGHVVPAVECKVVVVLVLDLGRVQGVEGIPP